MMRMTESQLRNHFVDTLRGWMGAKEGGAIHKRIIDTYNSLKPLPRNYAMTYKDAWCAATVSAAAIEAGLTDIIPRECSCTRMIELFKKIGRWMERDDYVPNVGDVIFYDWDDKGKGDCTGNPEHVGVVENVTGLVMTVIEGNYHDAVGRRTLNVNGRYIRGYGLPDYASLSDADPLPVDKNCDFPQDRRGTNTKPKSASVTAFRAANASLTNGGVIRSMDNADLAAFLENPPSLSGFQAWLDWLNAPANVT